MNDEVKLNANPTIHRRANNEIDVELLEIRKELNCGEVSEKDLQFLGELTNPAEAEREYFDASEIFELIRGIRDPEHPLSLEELNVVQEKAIQVNDKENQVVLFFTPTVPHCSMSTLIGLCLRVKLLRSLPVRFKVDIYVEPGSHVSEQQVNKQLNDKERVAAALENSHLLQVVNKCLAV